MFASEGNERLERPERKSEVYTQARTEVVLDRQSFRRTRDGYKEAIGGHFAVRSKREHRQLDLTKFYPLGSMKRSDGSFAQTNEQTLTCLIEICFPASEEKRIIQYRMRRRNRVIGPLEKTANLGE